MAPADRFSVIRLGIDLRERVSSGDGHREDLRRSLGFTPGQFVVGWIGRMTPIKRVPDVLEAFASLRSRGVDAALLLVGDGPDRAEAERLAATLGVAAETRFVGYQRDVGPYYGVLDTPLLPSASEGTPVVAIEALAAGRPVVATRVGGVPDVVTDGSDGLLVGVGDVEGMARALSGWLATRICDDGSAMLAGQTFPPATPSTGWSTTPIASTASCSQTPGCPSGYGWRCWNAVNAGFFAPSP